MERIKSKITQLLFESNNQPLDWPKCKLLELDSGYLYIKKEMKTKVHENKDAWTSRLSISEWELVTDLLSQKS